jgi:predicted nucleotidyltransferase
MVNNTASGPQVMERLFGSRLRARALGWLLTHPDERFFGRQLAQFLEEDPTNLSRELGRLIDMGILACTAEGRQKYYQIDRNCPIYEELRLLAVKTFGLADVLRAALSPYQPWLKSAFIYGSFAKGKGSRKSDVDLMLIGALELSDVAPAIQTAGKRLGREINPVLYSPNEFKLKAKDGHHFIGEVLQGEKIFLIGGEDELNKLAR